MNLIAPRAVKEDIPDHHAFVPAKVIDAKFGNLPLEARLLESPHEDRAD